MKVKELNKQKVFIVASVVFVNVILIFVSAYFLYQSKLRFEEQAKSTTVNVTNALEQNLKSSITRIDLALRIVCDELERQLAQGAVNERLSTVFLEKVQAKIPELEAFRVADEQGLVFMGSGVSKADKVKWSDRDYFIHHSQVNDNSLYIRKPRVGRVAKQYIVNLSRRYNYPDGRFAGVVSAPIAVEHLAKLLKEYDVGPHGTLIIRDNEFGLIARSPAIPDQPVGQISNASVSKEFREMVESGAANASYHLNNSPDGFERILTFRNLKDFKMIVITGVAIDDYLSPWKLEVKKTIATMIMFLIGSIVTAVLLIRSIKESHSFQEKLAQRERHLKAIIDNEPECIKIVDGSGNLVHMNRAGLAMIEAESLEQVIGQPVVGLVADEDKQKFINIHQQVIDGIPAQGEFSLRGLKGGVRVVETHAVPMQENGVTLHLAITRDVSERKLHEQQLIAAKSAAEAANIAKSAFLTTMSHEIRTPMNGILGVAQLIKLNLDSDLVDKSELSEHVEIIIDSGNSLLSLLNEILDLSRIEAGRITLDVQPVSPTAIMDDICKLFHSNADAKGLSLLTSSQLGGQVFLGDPIRLRQILSNLVSNAIKFTHRGTVSVEAREVSRHSAHSVLEFSVTDSGIGIAQKDMDCLFKPFSQVDSSTTRRYGGTGLGLSIVKKFAELMGGSAGVSSQEGVGSRFWFTVQLGHDAHTANHEEQPLTVEEQPTIRSAPGREEIHILLAEDNPTNQIVATRLLQKLGFQQIAVANNGEEAVRYAASHTPDIILMDCQMPVLDGYQATQQLRDAGCRVPVIALTANVMQGDREKSLAAGMNDYLGKPFSLDELEQMISKWV